MEALLYELQSRFGWRVHSGFTEDELRGLIRAGDDIAAAIERWLPGIHGDLWIRRFMGKTIFYKGGLVQKVVSLANGGAKISLVFVNRRVWLYPQIFEGPNSTQWVVHELGHVLENSVRWMSIWWGGGPGDHLVSTFGSKAGGLRWMNTKSLAKSLPAEASWQVHNRGLAPKYGDNSTADYFAEVWTWSIYRPDLVPLPARMWFLNWLRDLTLDFD